MTFVRRLPRLPLAAAAVALAAVLAATTASTAASAAPLELRFGHNIAVGTPTDLGAKRFAELVAERSKGEIVVKDYPGGQLGNEQQMIEGLQIGTLDMAGIVGATYGNVLPEANVLGLLYAFDDKDHMQKAMRGAVGKRLGERLLDQTSIHMIDASWYFGTRQLTSNRAVETPADLDGMKIRVVPVPIFEAGWSAMGATPTPVDFKELFTALQTNTVDAQENPLPNIKAVGVPLVNKYMTMSDHIIANMIVAMSDDAYRRLTPEQRELIAGAARDAGAYQDDLTVKGEEELLVEFKDGGMTVITPDKAAFAARVKNLPETWKGGVLKDIHAMIQDAR